MNSLRPLAFAVLLGCLPMLGACGSGNSVSDGITSAIDKSVSRGLDQAREKLHDQPIEVSHNDPDLPKAEITPDGDFVVGGKTLDVNPTQRAALLEYRQQLIAVASEGIEIGKQGAALGMHAAREAIAGALSGKSDEQIRKSVEAQTTDIRQAAAKICDRLPAMMAEQQKLASVLPAFKPYATMTREDIRDCREDALTDDDDRVEVRQKIRDRIRSGIRSGIQATAQTAGLASRGTQDAEAKDPAAGTSAH